MFLRNEAGLRTFQIEQLLELEEIAEYPRFSDGRINLDLETEFKTPPVHYYV
jgi:hypothetical protein